MQRKSTGQCRRKHGAHGASPSRRWWRGSPGNPGPVSSGEVLPKGTTTGTPKAAARCMGPVSLVITTRHKASAAINSASVVWPASEVTERPCRRWVSSPASGMSAGPPKRTKWHPVLSDSNRADPAKRSNGQRLAGPYSAPALSPMSGFPEVSKAPKRVLIAWDAVVAAANRGGTGSVLAPR